MENPNYLPLLDLYRSGYIDNRFFGGYIVYGRNGTIKEYGTNDETMFFLRSLFKPIQASIMTDEIIEYFNFSEEELSVMQGSHSGEPCHIKAVKSILRKINLKEEDLLCPKIPPLNTKIYPKDFKFTKIYNNCSGKHSMMLAYCKFKGYDIKTYRDFGHPVQKEIKEKLLKYAKTKEYIETKDGCTVPVYGLKIKNIAEAFLNYYEDLNNKTLIEAYKNNPYLIGGSDNLGKRTDTKITEISNKLISKVGAGGFIYVYNTERKEILVVKMAQNNNPEREIVTLELLYNLGWIEEKHYNPFIYTEDNEKIGEYKLFKP